MSTRSLGTIASFCVVKGEGKVRLEGAFKVYVVVFVDL